MKFSENLIRLRKQKGLSQEDLANQLDVSRQTVSKWELGVTTPEMEKLVQMSKIFGITVDDLISKEEVTADTTSTTKTTTSYTASSYASSSQATHPKMKKSSKIAVILIVTIISLVVIGYIVFFAWTSIEVILRTKKTWKTFDEIQNTVTQNSQEIDDKANNVKNTINEEQDKKNETQKRANEIESNTLNGYEDINKYINSDAYKEELKKMQEMINSEEYQNLIKDLQKNVQKNVQNNF